MPIPMPMRTAPLTLKTISMDINNTPAREIRTCVSLRFPSPTSVPGLSTTMPDHSRPTIAIRSPIPTAIEFLSERGTESIILSLNPKKDSRTNREPEMNTAPSAFCHGIDSVRTTV